MDSRFGGGGRFGRFRKRAEDFQVADEAEKFSCSKSFDSLQGRHTCVTQSHRGDFLSVEDDYQISGQCL